MPDLKAVRTRLITPRSATYIIVFMVVFAALAIMQPSKFLSRTNIQQMAFQFPEFGVLALAMMVAMLSGGIDLSITFSTNLAGIASALVLLSLSYGGRWIFKAY